MKKLIAGLAMVCMATAVQAQKYTTRTGHVKFYSGTPMENIEAVNNQVAVALDPATNKFLFQVPVKSFKFERALMEEHFNENYMESTTYPKAEYKGVIQERVNYDKDGKYDVTARGIMIMHGVTREVTIPGTVEVKGGKVTLKAFFKVKPKDYNINIPALVEEKIAKEIEVTVNTILEKK